MFNMFYSVLQPLSSLTLLRPYPEVQSLHIMTYFKAVLWESAPGNHRTTILPEQIVTGIRGDLWRSAIFELDQRLTRSSLQSYCNCTHVSVEVVNCDVYI